MGREGAGCPLRAREVGRGEESAAGRPGGEVPAAGRLTVTPPWITSSAWCPHTHPLVPVPAA